MSNFSKFISTFQTTDSEAEKGYEFEKFCKWYLENHPFWKNKIEKVWLFKDYPNKWREKEFGVDLVFKTKLGETWSVQAKCYNKDYYITYDDLSKFIAESGRPEIDKLLLMSSTDHIGPNARTYLSENLDKEVIKILRKDFEEARINYPKSFKEINKSKVLEKPKPTGKFKYQIEPINSVVNEFKKNNKGQLIMACGTGKTFTTLWIKEKLNSKNTLVLLPSLSLLGQTLKEWNFGMNKDFISLCVCSDSTVTKSTKYDDRVDISVRDLPFPVETDPNKIKSFLEREEDKVIFSTYQSSKMIEEALKDKKIKDFDLVISDEAHRCAGNIDSNFSIVLDDKKIRSKKKLFTTATPRTYAASAKATAKVRGVEIADMNNEDLFGKVFFKLGFSDAIEKKLLTDYQVVIIGVDDHTISEYITNRELIKTKEDSYTDAKSLAAYIGLIKAIKDYDLKRLISFHNRVSSAKSFSEEFQNFMNILSKKNIPKGSIFIDYVSGLMSTHKRKQKLDQLKELSLSDRMILSNARCLSEGVDVPALDGIAIIDPRKSKTDIVQTVGRAIRKSENKKVGTILLPIFINEETKDINKIAQDTNFKYIWEVIRALRAHDESLSFELDEIRTKLGKERKTSRQISGLSKVKIDIPTSYDKSFENSLKTVLIESSTESWYMYYGLLKEYKEKFNNTHVPADYETDDGYKLGVWVGGQRGRIDRLDNNKKDLLNKIGFVWDMIEFNFNLGFSSFKNFVKKNSHGLVPKGYKDDDGYSLDSWVMTQRTAYKKNIISKERIEMLEENGFIWSPFDEKWLIGFRKLEKYYLINQHVDVPVECHFEKYNLGGWVRRVRQSFKEGKLKKEYIQKLQKFNFVFDDGYDKKWEEGYDHLKKYFKEHQTVLVNDDLKLECGFPLGTWTTIQRQAYKNNKLSEERFNKLEKIGFVWVVYDHLWNVGFLKLKEYSKKNNINEIKASYITEDGYRLGSWAKKQILKRKKLSIDQKKKLSDIGYELEPITYDEKWRIGFNYLQKYIDENKSVLVRNDFINNEGYFLGKWVERQRLDYKKNKLPKERIEELNQINFIWDGIIARWEEGFQKLADYFKKNNNVDVPASYITDDGYYLGPWVRNRRKEYSKNTLSKERIDRLNEFGFIWTKNNNLF